MPLLGDALGGLVCRQALSAGELYRSEGVDRLGETVYAIDRGEGESAICGTLRPQAAG